MESVYLNSDYRSVWRPLNRENDPNTIGSASGSETPKMNITNTETLTMANEAPEQDDIFKKISEISDDINALNRAILEQSEKINNLLNLLEGKEGAGKKNVFGLQRK